jgi:hypothetical protein
MKIEDIPVLPRKIISDTYELATVPRVVEKLIASGFGHPKEYPLPFGDYWMRDMEGGLVSVERKKLDLADDWPRRLAGQLRKARGGGAKHVVLLCEGLVPVHYASGRLMAGERERKVTYDQVWSTLLGWQYKNGLKLYVCHEGSRAVSSALLAIQRYYRRI